MESLILLRFSYPLDGSIADAKLCAGEAPAAKNSFSGI